MKLTEFILFKNTPLNDFQNTFHFESNEKRDDFFLNKSGYEKKYFTVPFNFVRDRLTLSIPFSYEKTDGFNYCTFLSEFDNKRYYAFIIEIHYLNPETTKIILVIDTLMTFTQGTVLNNLKNIEVMREHLNKTDYDKYLPQLRTNDDVIKTTTKRYVKNNLYEFKDFYIVFTSSADLSKDFGTKDKPVMSTSSGSTVDNITSPANLYVCEQNKFQTLMDKLAEYPWITQNISRVLLIPTNFIKADILTNAKLSIEGFNDLKTFVKNSHTFTVPIDDLTYTLDELAAIYDIDLDKEKHLLRSEYTTSEFYSWDGQQLVLDNAFLPDTGLQVKSISIVGYENEVAFFVYDYKSDISEHKDSKIHTGTFLNNAIIYKSFNEVPILVDNYQLALSKNANQRQLAESKLITNRVENILDPKGKLEDKFFNTVSILSNVSLTGLFGKFSDEYEFYRTQKAQFKDMALTTPTITNQNYVNSLGIANKFYGLTFKAAAPTKKEMDKVRKYYQLFGFEINEQGTKLSDVQSMTICNYVQIRGNYTIENCDTWLVSQLKIQLENGVRFYHDNGLQNPFTQDLLENTWR